MGSVDADGVPCVKEEAVGDEDIGDVAAEAFGAVQGDSVVAGGEGAVAHGDALGGPADVNTVLEVGGGGEARASDEDTGAVVEPGAEPGGVADMYAFDDDAVDVDQTKAVGDGLPRLPAALPFNERLRRVTFAPVLGGGGVGCGRVGG